VNLYQVHHNAILILWIDALCIDPKNEAEKLVQVQKMDWIYANAYMVLIWLGGYHDHRTGQSCSDNGIICAHQEQIELASLVSGDRTGEYPGAFEPLDLRSPLRSHKQVFAILWKGDGGHGLSRKWPEQLVILESNVVTARAATTTLTLSSLT
jgi:hypothetical protein